MDEMTCFPNRFGGCGQCAACERRRRFARARAARIQQAAGLTPVKPPVTKDEIDGR